MQPVWIRMRQRPDGCPVQTPFLDVTRLPVLESVIADPESQACQPESHYRKLRRRDPTCGEPEPGRRTLKAACSHPRTCCPGTPLGWNDAGRWWSPHETTTRMHCSHSAEEPFEAVRVASWLATPSAQMRSARRMPAIRSITCASSAPSRVALAMRAWASSSTSAW